MRARDWFTVAVATGALLTGCTGSPVEPEQTTTSTTASPSPEPEGSSTSAPSSATSTAPPAPLESPAPVEQGPAQDTEAPGTGQSEPVWDEAAKAEAISRAEAFMRAFARPDLSDVAWHEGITGLMTSTGAELFAYTDPANVPAREVTGAGSALESRSVFLAEVNVPTDAGTYLVTLSRQSADELWLIEYADLVE